MCTISIVPIDGGYRLVCNRDERLTRAIARPPRAWPAEVLWATYPQDPESGGTWVGVNDHGLAAALLNQTAAPAARRAPCSRGAIVPALLACTSIDRAVRVLKALDCGSFEPFRVVLVHRGQIAVTTPDKAGVATEAVSLRAPVMFTSSSLGDVLVEAPRQDLFGALVLNDDDWLRGQFRFHRHQWTARPDISVQMSRYDAATVSRTTIHVTSRAIDMAYESLVAQPLTWIAAA
jgi:uncharacterized protein with NRDE domain